MKRRKIAAIASSLIAICIGTLVACTSHSNRSNTQYQKVDAVFAELSLPQAGSVLLDERYGTGGFSSDARTRHVVLAGTDPLTVLRTNLQAHGYSTTQQLGPDQYGLDSTELWSSGSQPTVQLSQLKPGQTAPSEQSSRSVVIPTSAKQGLVVYIRDTN